MKRCLLVGLIIILTVFSLAGCTAQTYDSVLNAYTQEIQKATPTLVQEFKDEASGVTDISKLAEISNQKIQKLAEICNQGIAEMAEIRIKNSDDNSVYEEWAKKLTDIYETEAKKITDEYQTVSQSALNSLFQ